MFFINHFIFYCHQSRKNEINNTVNLVQVEFSTTNVESKDIADKCSSSKNC